MKSLLKNFGLNEKEAQVYLAALELGEATGFQIYKKPSLKSRQSTIFLMNCKSGG
jgi:sugar-specific transcriptional regulator TrmB